MKIFWKISVLIFAFALSFPAFAQQTSNRVAIINLKKVFDNYWKTRQSKTVIEQQQAEADKQDKGLIESWKKSKEEYQRLLESANDQTVSAEERDRRKKAAEAELRKITATEQDIQFFRRQTDIKLDDAVRSAFDKIFEEIRDAVNAKAKTAGYSLVLDTSSESARGKPVVVYNNGENDLTGTILSQLNAGAPVESPKSVTTTNSAEKKQR